MSVTISADVGPNSFVGTFGDPSYSDRSVTLGDFVFNGWEVPEKVSWGGQQRMTVHKFVGGTRFIDVMGTDNQEISWSGRFLSVDAAFRADQVDQMRKAGGSTELVFAGRYYVVVISNFVAEQIEQFHIQYQISLTVLSDNSFVQPPDIYPLAAVTFDVTAASTIVVAPTLLPAQVAVAAISPLLVPMSSIAAGAAATVALAGALTATNALVTAAQTAADAQIAAVVAQETVAANLAGAHAVVGAVNNMQAALAATYASASAVAMSGYIGRASKNVANA